MRGPWEFEKPLCAEVGTEIFFADKDTPDYLLLNKQARKICALCTHRIECANWAIENHEEFGIWGGLGGRARMDIRNGRGKVA